jgi:cellulase/cellobiase CelA1
VLAACHLLWQPFFKEGWLAARPEHARALRAFLIQTVSMLAGVASADGFAKDEERCEELVRRALDGFGLTLPGESASEAQDRLNQVDSVERRRLLDEVGKRQAKLRREAELRRKADEEAASKVSRE